MIGSMLIHKCDIYTNTAASTNAYGQTTYTETQTYSQTPCRLVEKGQLIKGDEYTELAPVKTYTLLLSKRVSVHEGDIIRNVYTRSSLHNAGDFVIKSIIHRNGMAQRHTSVILEYLGKDG